MSMPNLRRSPWLWGLLAFLAGMAIIAVLPRGWVFVEPQGGDAAEAATKEVWACPMLCVRLDGPGTCPVCGMELEKLEDTGDTLPLNADERRLIDLATAPVERRALTHAVRAFGRVGLNQRRVVRISAYAPGRITRLFADTVYTDVRKGDHLFEMYSPELFAAQSEYLAARRGGGAGLGRSLQASAREKLSLLGLTDVQIAALEASGEAQHTMVIHSPASGTIFEIFPREGDYVGEGARLYTIADYSTLWLQFDAYEADLPWIAQGQDAEITLEAWPGRVFHGTIEFIDRAVDERTRTVSVRIVLDNQDWALKPGMYANVTIEATLGTDGRALNPGLTGRYSCYMHPEIRLDQPGVCPICGMPVELRGDPRSGPPVGPPKQLAIPRTAVLDTGERQLVYVMTRAPRMAQQDGHAVEVEPAEFEAREVALGPRAGELVAVVGGLREGERVVTRGNFMIDSQMELLGKPSLLHPQGSDAEGPSGASVDPHAGH